MMRAPRDPEKNSRENAFPGQSAGLAPVHAKRRAAIAGLPENASSQEDLPMATLTAVHPGKLSDQVSFRPRYGNYIGG